MSASPHSSFDFLLFCVFLGLDSDSEEESINKIIVYYKSAIFEYTIFNNINHRNYLLLISQSVIQSTNPLIFLFYWFRLRRFFLWWQFLLRMTTTHTLCIEIFLTFYSIVLINLNHNNRVLRLRFWIWFFAIWFRFMMLPSFSFLVFLFF